MDYQAPVDDTKDPDKHKKFLQMFFVILPLSFYIIYKTWFVRVNSFSKNFEMKIISDNVEKAIGKRNTNTILKEMKGLIYKEDSEEVKRVKNVMDTLIDKNNVRSYCRNIKIKVLHIPVIGWFMSLDQTFFISSKTLEISKSDDELAMIMAHELSHFLLQHLPLKIFNLYWLKKYKNIGSEAFYQSADIIQSAHGESIKRARNLQYFSWFYPERLFFTKYYERKADILSHELWNRAGFDILKGIDVYKFIVSLPSSFNDKNKKKDTGYNHYEMNHGLLRNFKENQVSKPAEGD